MMWLRSLAFNIAFFCWTGFIAILLLPALALPRMVTVRTVRVWVRGVFKLQRITGQRIEIRSRERVPPGPVIVASKHQSVWDTLIFNLVLDDPSFVLKRDLYRIPAFGWELRHAGMIAIDRKAGASALRDMVRDARAIAKSGRPIVIFPEGSRIAPGREAPYHPGVAALYAALELPVVSVALNSGLFWPRRGFIRRPGSIVLEFQPAIPPGLDRRAFSARLHEAIEGPAARLLAEANAAADAGRTSPEAGKSRETAR